MAVNSKLFPAAARAGKAGVPEAVQLAADARLKIPMCPGLRSLNVALAAAMAAGEALRQTGGMPPSL